MTISNRGTDAYKQTETATVKQDRLIIMLYDGALKFLKIAMQNMNLPTYDIVNTNILKVQDILTELMFSINLESGKDIGMNLFHLYAYLKKRLLEANLEKNKEILEEVYKHLSELREAWQTVVGKDSSTENSSLNDTSKISIQG